MVPPSRKSCYNFRVTKIDKVLDGDTIDVTFEKAGDYEFQCDPHAGAGMKGVIHVQ